MLICHNIRCAQDDKTSGCHPEHSKGSLADFWGITRSYVHTNFEHRILRLLHDLIGPYSVFTLPVVC